MGSIGILGGHLVDGVAGLPAAADDEVIFLSHQSADVILESSAVGALGHGGLKAILVGSFVQGLYHLGQEHLRADLVAHQRDLHALAGLSLAGGLTGSSVAVVSGRGIVLLGAAARQQGQGHSQRQKHCKSLFHVFPPTFIFGPYRKAGCSPYRCADG